MALYNQFRNSRPKSQGGIGACIAHLQAIRVQLAGTTEAISTQALQNHMYFTAPVAFKTTIAILKRTENVSIDNITNSLIEMELENASEARIGDPNLSQTSGAGLIAQGKRFGNRGRGGNGGRNKGKGLGAKTHRRTICRMDKHATENCRRRQNSPNPPNPSNLHIQSWKHARSNSVLCYQCGENRHLRRDCPLKKRIDEMITCQKVGGALLASTETALMRVNSDDERLD